MDMKINSKIVIELRKSKAWSQQHLSDISNLSLRTIQRVENNGTGSNETIQSLASAFDINVRELLVVSETASKKAPMSIKNKGVLATIVAMSMSCIFYMSVSSANEIEIKADERFSQNDTTEIFSGNVGISIPKGKDMEVNALELWTSGDATFVQGEVNINVGTTVIKFEQGTLLDNGDFYLINSEEAIISDL